MIAPPRHDPVMLFRFALREGDLRLAALLARVLSRDSALRSRLRSELQPERQARAEPASVAALRVVGDVLASLDVENGERG